MWSSDSPGRFWEHLSFIKYWWNSSSIAKCRSNVDAASISILLLYYYYKQTVLLICLVELVIYNYLQVNKTFWAIIFRSFLNITQYLIKTHIVKNIDGKLLETLCHMFVVERVTRVLRQEILSSPSIFFHHLSCTQAHGVLGSGLTWSEGRLHSGQVAEPRVTSYNLTSSGCAKHTVFSSCHLGNNWLTAF